MDFGQKACSFDTFLINRIDRDSPAPLPLRMTNREGIVQGIA